MSLFYHRHLFQIIPKSNTEYDQVRPTSTQAILSIPRVQAGHYGNYSCTVGNEVGERTWNFTLLEIGEAFALGYIDLIYSYFT